MRFIVVGLLTILISFSSFMVKEGRVGRMLCGLLLLWGIYLVVIGIRKK